MMDVTFSVFNSHINDAFNKAKTAFIKRFSQEEWDKSIQPYQNKGIMSIFKDKSNQKTLWFVEAVGIYVNEVR